MPVKLLPALFAFFICCLPAATALSSSEDSLIFTVQLGSYESLKEAENYFDRYAAALPDRTAGLRIESHPPYYALRAGSFTNRKSARALQKRMNHVFADTILVQAYYIEDRIILSNAGHEHTAPDTASYIPSSIHAHSNNAELSIVPEGERITDFQAMVMLAELLLEKTKPESLDRAGLLLDQLLIITPDCSRSALLLIRYEAARGNPSRVAELTQDYLKHRDFDPAIFIQIADIASSLGHFERCRDIYLKVLERTDGSEGMKVKALYADRSMLWGDFYTSEVIIREDLGFNAGDSRLLLRLARNMIAQQRFVEARKYLYDIIRNSAWQSSEVSDAWIEKINLGLLEKDYALAALDTDEFLSTYGTRHKMLIPGARAYYEAGRIQDAENLYRKALHKQELRNDALIGLALIKLSREEEQAAAEYLSAVSHDSRQYPLAGVLYHQGNERNLSAFIKDFLRNEQSPFRLESLGQALAGRGYFHQAVRCYEKALMMDDEYFPAKIGLAEVQGASGQFQHSLATLESLLAVFPDSYKLLLTRARVLAWSRDYQSSIDAHYAIYLDNPANPVVLLEAARTAYWGKMADRGNKLYRKVFTPSVDFLLLQRLMDLKHRQALSIDEEYLDVLAAEVNKNSVFEGYEHFFSQHDDNLPDHDSRFNAEIMDIRHDLHHIYIIQKRAFLEQKSKHLAWNRRFAPARRSLEQLTAFDPGNQEALFDLAQASCTLGLCDEEKNAYEVLLGLDPLHGQAGKALDRQRVRSRPLIFGGYSLWKEKGRGELARMTRHRFDLGLEVPVMCRHRLKLTAHRYIESPQKYGKAVPASGLSLEGSIVTGPYISFFGSVTHKAYDNDLKIRNFSELAGTEMTDDSFRTGISDITMGNLNMRANLDNYAALTLGYEKREEVANVLALAQGIYSNRFRARLDMYPARKLDMALEAEYMDYSDDNSGYVYGGEIGYAFTDHPRTFKTILSARYRDTSRDYLACPGLKAQCSITDDFRHPYWTPQDYWEAAITFEFIHDLAKDFFCGAREHFYDIQLTLGTEQNSNNSVELRGLWQNELTDRLGIRVQGMWHYSREWKAAAADLGLLFRF